MSNAGIDYSMGQSNVDKATGIHFGVISLHSISPEAWDLVEYDYGDPTCPMCNGPAVEYDESKHAGLVEFGYAGEYTCESCKIALSADVVFADEPIGFKYERDGYKLADCLDSDMFVALSPYYTFAQYCSPCVPGAGNLDIPCPDGPKTYCLDHEWFESGKAPYTVFRVIDNTKVDDDATKVTKVITAATTECPQCGKVLETELGHAYTKQFCSKQCYQEYYAD
jgi:endogenous inhibitor of DNA gyrase (YacG/DUF329 family)